MISALSKSNNNQSCLILRRKNVNEFLYNHYGSNIQNSTTTLSTHPNKAAIFDIEKQNFIHSISNDVFVPT
jgi:hypothetical protein